MDIASLVGESRKNHCQPQEGFIFAKTDMKTKWLRVR
jgi:hypothetical protein